MFVSFAREDVVRVGVSSFHDSHELHHLDLNSLNAEAVVFCVADDVNREELDERPEFVRNEDGEAGVRFSASPSGIFFAEGDVVLIKTVFE